MQTANNQKTKRRPGALQSAIVLLLLTVFSQAAQAVPLRIDQTRSEIRSIPSVPFCLFDHLSGELVCPPPTPPQTFTMTGSIDVSVIHLFGADYGVDSDLLYLRTTDLSTDAYGQGFYLNDVFALLTGETFEARGDDPCFLFVGPGSCSGWVFLGWAGNSEGTWDGHTLVWNGYLPPRITFSGMTDAFNYTIIATAVPEPGTISLMLLMLPLALYFGFSRRANNRGQTTVLI